MMFHNIASLENVAMLVIEHKKGRPCVTVTLPLGNITKDVVSTDKGTVTTAALSRQGSQSR